MKTLCILRHAKTEKYSPSGRDFDRRLAAKGQKGALLIGDFLKNQEIDLVLCSAAQRTRETWAIVADFVKAQEVLFSEQLYLAPVNLLLHEIKKIPLKYNSLLLVGHNPGMAELAIGLSNNQDQPDHWEMQKKYPTAGLAKFELESWNKLETYRLSCFITPARLEAGIIDED